MLLRLSIKKEKLVMKYDFTFYNPTRIHFGKNSLDNLKDELSNYGKNILLKVVPTISPKESVDLIILLSFTNSK